MPRTARFTRDDWAAAALEALTEGGVNAVAVEPVAARLGASKSSFYWLFDNRQALLEAALTRWEDLQTDQVVTRLAGIADPAARLHTLLHQAFTAPDTGDLALRLLTESDDPAVRAVVQRVTHRRLTTLETAYAEAGHPPAQASHYATAAYAVYLGTAALNRIQAAPTDTTQYLTTLETALAPKPPKAPTKRQGPTSEKL